MSEFQYVESLSAEEAADLIGGISLPSNFNAYLLLHDNTPIDSPEQIQQLEDEAAERRDKWRREGGPQPLRYDFTYHPGHTGWNGNR